jgi:hypothetical protein
MIYNKLILKQIASFSRHNLKNHGQFLAALLCTSVKTVKYGKGLGKNKKKFKRR